MIQRWLKMLSVFLTVAVLSGCYMIPRGEVGIRFSKYGTEKGVQEEILPSGKGMYNPFTTSIYVYPTFTQTIVWEGSKAISFQTKEGMKVSGPIGLMYHVDGNKAHLLFQKYRHGIDEITDKFLWNIVRDAFNVEASTVAVEAAYGTGKADLLVRVEERVRKQVEPIGLIVERISYAGDLVLPEEVRISLNRKVEATQISDQRRNEVEQSKAEADKERERAKGVADALLIVAEAEAASIELRAKALRDNRDIIQLNAIEKWDGKLPTYVGGGNAETPFIKVN